MGFIGAQGLLSLRLSLLEIVSIFHGGVIGLFHDTFLLLTKIVLQRSRLLFGLIEHLILYKPGVIQPILLFEAVLSRHQLLKLRVNPCLLKQLLGLCSLHLKDHELVFLLCQRPCFDLIFFENL